MLHEAEPDRTGAELGRVEAEPGPGDAESVATDAADREAAETPAETPAEAPAEQATGEPRVDAALKLLERLPGLPVSDHPELFEQVHARLSEVLDELESGSGAGPAGG